MQLTTVLTPRYLLQLSVLVVAYVITGWLSLGMMVNEGLASLVWPPTGISIAALMLTGYRLWPGVFIGALLTNVLASGDVLLASIIGAGNTAEALLAVWLLRQLVPTHAMFDGLRNTLLFIGAAALIAPLPSAGAGVLGMLLQGSIEASQAPRTFGMWFLGDLMGALTLTPAIFLIGQRWQQRGNTPDTTLPYSGHAPEQVALICATTLVSVAVYALPHQITTQFSYLPFLLVLWGALRLPLIQALMLSLMVSVIAVSGTLVERASMGPAQVIEQLTFLYLFLATQTATVLLVGAVMRDRERIAEQLLRAQQQAEAASAQKSQFLTNISHEIRTPLNGIIGVTGIMLPEASSNRQREQLRIIQNSADSLLSLLNDLLDHARIEAGKLSIVRQTFALPQLLRDIVGLFESQAEARGLRLRAQLSGNIPQYAVSDDVRIRQILVNVLGNALKFTQRGEISLTVTRLSQHGTSVDVQFSVEDTGIGIAAEAQQKIFEPFTQADNTTSRLYGGSGLGLTISRQLAEQLGGTLRLTSTEGIGTRVDIVLPLQQPSLSQELSYQRRVEHRELESGAHEALQLGRRILVAEDNPVNAQVTEQMLRNLGHDVTVAENGQAVLALWQQGFDLILMDCLMPIIDGYDATRRIRSLERDAGQRIPIVALTANAMNDERDKCLAAGMDDYLAKPIRLKDLDRMLRRHLRERGDLRAT